MPVPLTVVIPTLNEEKQIAAALEALPWADEVIVADGGSSDRTAELARSHGAAVIEVRGESIGLQRNAAIARARNEWVLALDADERVTEALREELVRVLATPAHEAYRVRCENYFLGRERSRGRWGRDWHVRLFRRHRRFSAERVHEHLEAVHDVGELRGPIVHVPYRDLTHHLEKMMVYARWGAGPARARSSRHRVGHPRPPGLALRARLFLVRELAGRALRAGDVVAHRLRRVPQVRLPLGARPNAVGAARRLNHGGGSGPRCGFRF